MNIGEKILKKFFFNYLIENNLDEVEKLFSESFKSVGTSQFEIAKNKSEFLLSIRNQIENLKGKMSFYINDYVEDYFGDLISSYCEVTIIYFEEEEKKITTRLTTVFFKENDEWRIINMHNSIAKITQEKNEMFPISYMSKLEQNNETNIFLLEKFRRGFFSLKEIAYIVYSSITRKTIFYLNNLESFELKKKFSEVEEKLKKFSFFCKVDRGTLVNLESIKILDFKEECIVFKNQQILYLSKVKLKKIENRWKKIKKEITRNTLSRITNIRIGFFAWFSITRGIFWTYTMH